MSAAPHPPPPQLVLTARGCLLGMRMVGPTLPGVIAFAVAFGAAAAQKGVSLSESVAMSLVVCAGAAQMLSLELWRETWSASGILTIALVTATVNARFVLQGASLQPWLKDAPALPRWLSLLLLFEASWIVTERHRAGGGRDVGVMLGAGLLSWAVWWAATAPGYLAGALVSDPRRFGLDLVMLFFFAAMTIPLWRGVRASAPPWAVAAIVGLTTEALVPGYLFIVTGALAGALTGGLQRERR